MRPITRTQPFTQQQEKDQSTLQELSRIRLDNIFLPIGYLKKAQKIFHRYDQQQLREIAQHFSNYMALRYTEEKFNYDLYPQLKFEKLEHKVPSHKKVQQIYLIGQQKLYQQRQQQEKRKVDEDPTKPEISYTQNVAISYLLNRVPRTFASALRIFVEIKYKFPNFKPKSMIDFGSGLSSGSYAFLQAFPNTVQLYNVQPAGKMRKLSKYITQETRIQHYQTLGQLSKTVRSVDLVYAGYVINEIKPEMVEVYLQALYAKVKPGGLLVFCQYGNPFGARIIHQIRKWAINKKAKPVAPCPHSLACPLAKGNQWCHFDQPTGVYPKRIFGTLPTDQGIQLQKFSYIVIQKSNQVQNEYQSMIQKLDLKQNVTKQWDRVIFPTMKRGGHILLNVCTKQGKFQRRISSRSHGDQYKIAKRLRWGDLWRFSKRIPNKFRKNRTTGQKTW